MGAPKKRINLECLTCKKKIEIQICRLKTFKYCSKKCMTKASFGHRPYNYKGGRMIHKGYIYLLRKDHPKSDRDGYVLEHRIIMEKKIKRYLKSEEIVHHKDSNRNNNNIKNLELHSSQAEHMKRHYPKGKHIYKKRHPWIGRKHSISSRIKMSETRQRLKKRPD